MVPFCSKYNSQEFRNERYWNEECDFVLKKYKPVVEGVYSLYSGTDVPGKKPFVSLESFRQMCIGAGVLDEKFVERDVPVAFNLSMMTQVDELNNNRFIEMTFVEFLEALARVAEQISLHPIRLKSEEVCFISLGFSGIPTRLFGE